MGKFITVEGIEGVGKTTQLDYIRDYLVEAGHSVLVTREPGGTALGEEIRKLVLGVPENPMLPWWRICPEAEALLMCAARAEHLESVVKPALANGQWVVCDRFFDSTYAYQGGGRGLAEDRLAVLEEWVCGSLKPDLTLLLDLTVLTGRARARAGNRWASKPDRIESEDPAFFARVRNAYLKRAANHPARIKIVDARGSIKVVKKDVERCLEEFINGIGDG